MERILENARRAGLTCLLAGVALMDSRALSGTQTPRTTITASFLDPGAFIHGLYPARRRATEGDVRAEADAGGG
ncbi:MAG: hypothetical protein HN742_41540 [Lentisphaerae bacterium]|nr:hypothetical protein [Lentisphaerota bacterium]MBT4816970.1 hypothetical protein [Lentisphaerota bacterium]MBT5611742.1 hypothetical protein [Lentisphaerota bacterium]MBT7054144.1 hypothetical protein [Lentisphaerota bacterium]MBT7848421.1 hypothetical protein [Lentisphaerota bacterium]